MLATVHWKNRHRNGKMKHIYTLNVEMNIHECSSKQTKHLKGLKIIRLLAESKISIVNRTKIVIDAEKL